MIDLDAIATLADIPRAQAKARGAQTAILFEGETLSYAELDRRSNQVANAMIAANVTPGARISVLAKNHPRWFEVFFGAAKARACLAPINARLAAPEAAFVLEDSDPALFFVGEDFFDIAEQALAGLARRPRLIALTGERAGFEPFEAWRDAAPATDPALGERLSDDVLQLYTSGTTGRPKGVVLTNRNYRRFMEMAGGIEGFAYEPEERVLIVMPLFHVAGTNVSFSGLAQGGTLVLMKDFTPAEALALIEAQGVAHAFLAPAMILMLLQAPQIAETRLSSLRSIAYGASPISEEVLRRAQAAFGCGFVQFYGMTESAGAGTALSPSAHEIPGKLRSCGQAWPDVEVAVLDPEGRPTPVGEVGEIAIRGDIVMDRYWNRPEASAETVRDGWLFTGDAGYFDEDGFLYIHDRLKDMIVTGGENVYPAEVENAIFGCPGVADVAVIGVPSERWGEEVKAVVVLVDDAEADPQSVIAWAKSRIAGYKAPKSVDFVEALPRNPSGKVLRRELRKPYWVGRDRAVS
ncbi:MAG: long-chain-fatty-acid--CoA ligase [Caulobacteraceae bacterium]|nr:long-chain-fatty-acid--CoA ligase [Caulobacteraceae bacterium]